MNYYFFQIIIISKYFKVYSGWFSAARIYFLEIRTLKSLNLRTINSSTRKYILGYCIQFMEKKINSNSILQNLKFLKLTPFWTHFITRSCRWLRKLKDISSTTRRQRSMCNREFDPGLIDRWWYPSNKLYNLHTV